VDSQQTLTEQAISRRVLEALCAPADLDDLSEALTQLEKRGVDLVKVERALMKARALDSRHRDIGRQKTHRITVAQRRERVRRDLLEATSNALAWYKDFYKGEAPRDARPIYVLCRTLHEAIGKKYADVLRELLNGDPNLLEQPALLPDPLYADDDVWSARQRRKAGRGPRPKPHLAGAKAELKAAGVRPDLVPVLLRYMIR
jgi:hypothetical protein